MSIYRWVQGTVILISTVAFIEAIYVGHVVRIFSGGPDPRLGGVAVFIATPLSISIGAWLLLTRDFGRKSMLLAVSYTAISVYILFEVARYMSFIDRVMHNF